MGPTAEVELYNAWEYVPEMREKWTQLGQSPVCSCEEQLSEAVVYGQAGRLQ